MLKNYLLTAYRNMQRNKVASFINISGLSVAMAVFFMAIVVWPWKHMAEEVASSLKARLYVDGATFCRLRRKRVGGHLRRSGAHAFLRGSVGLEVEPAEKPSVC